MLFIGYAVDTTGYNGGQCAS